VISTSIFEYDEELHMNQIRQEGRAEGEYLKLICLIRNMMAKNFSAEKIAELFEEDLGLVQRIIDLVKAHPDATDEAIYELLAGIN
jgi:c-di-GMP-related signal transduction protein